MIDILKKLKHNDEFICHDGSVIRPGDKIRSTMNSNFVGTYVRLEGDLLYYIYAFGEKSCDSNIIYKAV